MSKPNHAYCSGAINKRTKYSGCGAIIYLNNPPESTVELICPLGVGTLEEAEYCSVVMAMDDVHIRMNVDKLIIYTDSELVANQINGKQECKAPRLKPYVDLIQRLLRQHQPGWVVEWTSPAQNSVAQRFANKGVRTHCVWPNMTPRKYLDACIETIDEHDKKKKTKNTRETEP